jgi:hypothetical protein
LCRHLLQDHLLVPETELESPSQEAIRAKNTVKFLKTIEKLSGDPEAVTSLIAKMTKEAIAEGNQGKANSALNS